MAASVGGRAGAGMLAVWMSSGHRMPDPASNSHNRFLSRLVRWAAFHFTSPGSFPGLAMDRSCALAVHFLYTSACAGFRGDVHFSHFHFPFHLCAGGLVRL